MAKSEMRHRIAVLVLLWTAFATLLRTIRWPNDWSEAHWLVSYELGFLKRALPGTFLKLLLSFDALAPHAEWLIRIVASGVLAVFCATLLGIGARVLAAARDDATVELAGIVFFTSPFFVLTAHLNGYFDHIILLAAVGACWLVLRGRVLAASLLVTAALLVHETVLVIGLPSVLLVAFMRYVDRSDPSKPLRLAVGFLRSHGALIGLPLVVFVVLYLFQNHYVEPLALKARLVAHFEQFDFILRNKDTAVARAYSTPFSYYADSQAWYFRQRLYDRGYQLEVLPPVALLLYQLVRCRVRRALAWLVVPLALCVTALPLVLHRVAWDTGRIWTYLIVVAGILVWGAFEVSPPDRGEGRGLRALYGLLAGTVIIAQIYGTTALLDKQVERFDTLTRTLLYAPTMGFVIFVIVTIWRGWPAADGDLT